MRSTQLKTEMKRKYSLQGNTQRGMTIPLWKGDNPPTESELRHVIQNLPKGWRLSYQCNFAQEIVVE